MKYRKLKNTGFDISALGFGLMRLPTTDGKNAVDEKQSIELIRTAIDNGVNYIDTAYNYSGGNSEIACGKALKDGYREKIKLATKNPVFMLSSKEDFNKKLDEQLKRLDVDYIDYYLLHALTAKTWENKVLKFGLLEQAEKAKKEGKIRHIGFSFHDELDVFKKIVDGYDKWEFCYIQMNYMNETHQAGLEGLKYASGKGLDVIIMEPLLGGRLANHTDRVNKIFESSNPERPPVEWALDYLWDMPEVGALLSGMNTMEQITSNIKFASNSGVNMFSDKERQAIKDAQQALASSGEIPCTACGYCLPCPVNVNIPANFKIYNELSIYNAPALSKGSYAFLGLERDGKTTAKYCVKCGECEGKCPQNIKISELMEKVHKSLI